MFDFRRKTKEERIQEEIDQHLQENKRDIKDEYYLILEKKSKLSRRCREFICEQVK
jgi:hypothetical protein